ncbi:hypothetical protein F53441_9036 [Fusarium austroafricanum]|uniref:Uncharacterized protein n=1 Tax=Fusarium austroafricanum TaxID=2364996 RepID=A0A8H4KBX6_9HYPO|nr:hypothetical protein F53441_9036 [Fusarium austroafricanum]
MGHIWVASAWKFPCLHDPPQLQPQLDLIDNALVSIRPSTAENLGMPQLASLPPEVIRVIRDYIPHNLFWRIKTWKRGQQVEYEESNSESSVIRLTIDCYGLKEIQKLEDWPEYGRVRSKACVYSFWAISGAKLSLIHFKFGRAFMERLGQFKYDDFWDTPTPPFTMDSFASPSGGGSKRYRTIDLQNITGLTFFYLRGMLVAVHPHTAGFPTAAPAIQHLPPKDRDYLIWAYVPLSNTDALLRIGVRDTVILRRPTFVNPTMLISTKLAGDFTIGPKSRGTDGQRVSGNQPSVFIHHIPSEQGVGTFGAVSATNSWKDPRPSYPRLLSVHRGPPYYDPVFTGAPVKNVVHVDIYHSPNDGYCKGLLLRYRNGAQRALGQCRIVIDPFKPYAEPSWICYYNFHDPGTLKNTGNCMVECTAGSNNHVHEPLEFGHWACFPMVGHFDFACDHETANIAILPPRNEVDEEVFTLL